MCLPTLGEIKEITEKNGYYIIAHGNFAVRKIKTAEAKETLEILKNACAH